LTEKTISGTFSSLCSFRSTVNQKERALSNKTIKVAGGSTADSCFGESNSSGEAAVLGDPNRRLDKMKKLPRRKKRRKK
jgi:hypothetical protein